MNEADEKVRDAITDTFTKRGIDARNLAVEVRGGAVSVSGSVPSEEQREKVAPALAAAAPEAGAARISVSVAPVPPSDSLDGRGRSPVTGTSADSAHESRHQLDR
jgi:hypothetical protein